ncbi:MAG: hypothetical protein DBY32_04485 [Phascolarctobacterium sp.]|nr:MAG: hypothetical protein DBY32_04485 [Phascolarctobacterium sp.]
MNELLKIEVNENQEQTVSGSPQTYRMRFIEAENINAGIPTVKAKGVKPGIPNPPPKIKADGKVQAVPAKPSMLKAVGEFIATPQKPLKRIMQVRAIAAASVTGIKDEAFACYCEEDEGALPEVCCMTKAELQAKDIRLGDWVEVQGDKILHVLKEKRGAENAEETKGIKNPL